ncbi:MAG: hypothetical protein ABIR18_07145 [Chitinophagaceae bacterium]
MVFNKSRTADINREKQIDFVSRLTFVRGLKDEPKKEFPKETKKRRFKQWNMPVQPGGYIKCRKHDFL